MSDTAVDPLLRAGACAVGIDPPLPVDPTGYVRRSEQVRSHSHPLQVTACVIEQQDRRVAVLAGDVVGMTTTYADAVRAHVAAAIDADPADVLVNASHSHAALWPGAPWKLGGATDEYTDAELAYFDWLPFAYASAALQAADSAASARVAGAVGRVSGVAVNRRERTADGRTILGWNPDGFVDEEVPTIRLDGLDGSAIATLVGFGCHPVVVGPDVARTSSDFVGPLRERVSALRGGVCVFLQGAAGNVLPLEAFHDTEGPEIAMGDRLGLEAAHAVADQNPVVRVVEKLDFGSVTPISLYRRRPAADQPAQRLEATRRTVAFPLLQLPDPELLQAELAERRAELRQQLAAGGSRTVTNPLSYHVRWLEQTLRELADGTAATALEGEIWAARLGPCAIVGAPGEIFSEIGAAVRRDSPARVTIFAGYSQGVLGYVSTAEEYPFGGYEPAVSHRGYGHPAPFAPEVGALIRDTCLELLADLFPEAESVTAEARS